MSDERKNRSKYSSLRFLYVAVLSITSILSVKDVSGINFYKPLTDPAAAPSGIHRTGRDIKPAFSGDAVPAAGRPVSATARRVDVGNDTIPVTDDSVRTVADTIPFPAPTTDSSGLRQLPDSAALGDTLAPQVIDTLSLNLSKDTLDEAITYSASDSIVFILPEKKIVLFNEGLIQKGSMELTADSIVLDQAINLVTANSTRDSTGLIVKRPKMVQDGTTMQSDVIRYNTKTQKGITQGTITQQGEIFIQGERVKKISMNDFYAAGAQFTTCNLDTPHFAFRAGKMKLVSKKLAVTGPIHPEFEGVPVPIYLPFGIFPISQGRHSGLLPPTPTASDQFGLGLENLGYYKVINDNFDVLIRGNVYSYGGWAASLQPEYRKRYKYNGRMLFTLQRTRVLGNDPKADFTDTRTFNVNWSHTVDAKARPGTTFSANVNAGSTKFNRLVVNNPVRNYTNQMYSSITYSKTWDGKYNMTMSANHSQNNNSGLINLNLPTVAFTANTFYPLQKKEFSGTPKWYEKLGIGLNSNLANKVSFYDSLFNFRNILDTMQWGAQHSVPIQLSLPALGPLQVSPGISYSERWFSRQFIRDWNPAKNGVDTIINKGFFTSRDISFSLSLATALFGTFDKFGENSKVRAIRHVIRPTLSLSYKPDLAGRDYYRDTVFVDTAGNARVARFSKYEGSLYSPFSPGRFGGISFGFDNNLEMKIRSKKDTGEAAIRKVKIIDGFGFNGSYNFLLDSFQLSPMVMYVRSNLFDKINITAGATLDPYQLDEFGERIDRYAWSGGKFSPGRITNGNIAISTSFKSKPKDEKKEQEKEELLDGQAPLTMEEQMAELEYTRQNPGEFADFNIPWSLNLSYSLSFSRTFKQDYSGFETRINSNISLNGDFNLTPRWKMGLNTYYDIKTSSIQMLTMFISREMHCWQMSINVTPVGIFRSFNITVSPKSGLLRDLKINRTRTFYGG